MALFPADTESRRTDSRACAIVHYQFDSNHWAYRQITGNDVGCDCEFELSEDNRWLGHKIECQIKGTRHVENYFLKDMRTISYPLEIQKMPGDYPRLWKATFCKAPTSLYHTFHCYCKHTIQPHRLRTSSSSCGN